MPENIYRELRKRIDKLSFGFPATDSGIELEILRKLFSEEDAATWLLLTPRLETSEEIAQRFFDFFHLVTQAHPREVFQS